MPILAAEIPSVPRGTLAKDGTWVIWRLKRGVTWHDGKPFTADDVIFNWEYATDPATAAVTSGSYTGVERAEKVDSHAVKLVFGKPQPFWFDAFCGYRGMIIPKHLFEAYRGAKSARRPPTSSRWAPGRTSSWSSSPATSCGPRSTRPITCRTARSSTPSR